jgi:hypothetical protein
MGLIAALLPLINNIFALIPNPAERAARLQELMTALQNWDSQQADVNKVEAANQNLFVSGWRPMIGWICAGAVGYQYIAIPLLTWGFAAIHMVVPPFPSLDNNMWELVFGMLGMSGLRTIEKMQGGKSKGKGSKLPWQ